MVGEFKITRASRQCAIGKRPLVPGEVFYSVLTENDEDFRRLDIAAEHWTGPPEDAIGWWKNRVPMPEEKKRELAPPEVLVDLLRSMADQPERAKSRYLLALLLLRKRHLRMRTQWFTGTPIGRHDDAPVAQAKSNETTTSEAESTPEILHLESALDGSPLDVAVVAISASEAQTLQDELTELTYR